MNDAFARSPAFGKAGLRLLTSLQPLLQAVEFLQRGEGRHAIEVEVAEFVHDGVLFRGEEGALLFALLFRGAFGDFGFARVVEVVRFERLQDDLRAVEDRARAARGQAPQRVGCPSA